jgi:hypothetical protein
MAIGPFDQTVQARVWKKSWTPPVQIMAFSGRARSSPVTGSHRPLPGSPS